MSKARSVSFPGLPAAGVVHARKVWQRPHADVGNQVAPAPANQAVALILRGPLDAAKLTVALEDMTIRYPFLCRRTLSVVTSQESGAGPRMPVTSADLSGTDAAERPVFALCRDYLRLGAGFDNRSEPLARASLVRLAPERHLLCVVAASSTCDPATFGVLMRDLGRAYSARLRGEQPPAPLPVRPQERAPELDFTRRRHERHAEAGGPSPQGQTGVDAGKSSPADRLQDGTQLRDSTQGPDSDAVQFRIPEGLSAAVARLAARSGTSELAVHLATYVLLLARLTGRPASRVALNRADLAAAALPLLFGTLGEASPAAIVIDTRSSGDQLLADIHARIRRLAATGKDAEEARPPLEPLAGSEPVAAFRYGVRLTRETIEFAGLAVEALPVAAGHPVETGLALACDAQGLTGEWRYDRRRLDETTIRGWIACYRTLLRSFASESDSPLALLELLPDEQLRVMTGWNAARWPGPAPSVQERVAQEATRASERIALQDGGTSLSWRELESRSNRLARHLQVRGVSSGMRVGILLEAGIDRVVAQLAVLKAGAACVPLDLSLIHI